MMIVEVDSILLQRI